MLGTSSEWQTYVIYALLGFVGPGTEQNHLSNRTKFSAIELNTGICSGVCKM